MSQNKGSDGSEKLTPSQLGDYYIKMTEDFPIVSIEDGFDQVTYRFQHRRTRMYVHNYTAYHNTLPLGIVLQRACSIIGRKKSIIFRHTTSRPAKMILRCTVSIFARHLVAELVSFLLEHSSREGWM